MNILHPFYRKALLSTSYIFLLLLSTLLLLERTTITTEKDFLKTENAVMGVRMEMLDQSLKEAKVRATVEEICYECELSRVPGEYCDADSCLYYDSNKVVMGYAKLQGYYTVTERFAEDGSGNVMCDSFVVLSGNEKLIKDLKTQVANGIKLNSISSNGNLVLTLGPSEENMLDARILPDNYDLLDKEVIVSSSINNPIDLDVIRIDESLVPLESGLCHSSVKVMSAR